MNAIRSVNRYVASALGNDFEVRWLGDDDAFAGPFCRIASVSLQTSPHGSHYVEQTEAFSITAYPETIDALNDDASMLEAHRVRGLLVTAFAAGVDEASFSRRSNRRHPRRIPLWDFTGLPVHQPVAGQRIGYMRVSAADFEVIEAEDGPVVTGDLRLNYIENIALPANPNLVQHVHGRPAA